MYSTHTKDLTRVQIIVDTMIYYDILWYIMVYCGILCYIVIYCDIL